MERHNKTIGLPVICAPEGKQIGIVKDIAFCSREKRVKAIYIEQSGIRIRSYFILLEDIFEIGKDAVIVNNSEKIVKIRNFKDVKKLFSNKEIIKMNVYSKSGNDLGVVKDVLFDSKTGNIEGVEVSEGIFEDLIQGRKIVPLIGKYEFGEENLLVGKDAVEEIISTGGGLKNKIFQDSFKD